MNIANNKWTRGAIPALLIHCSIGTVYCWSLLKDSIISSLQCSSSKIEWAFSLSIFFLGMSAAFLGNIVEKNVRLSAIISLVCFYLGMIGTGIGIKCGSPSAVLLCYGCIMGIGLGVGYLTPVKTLMMWFRENKGLATGIAITGFGLAKVIASPLIEWSLSIMSIENTFYFLGSLYSLLIYIGAALIKKPENCPEMKGTFFSLQDTITFIKNKQYLAIWFVFFINIACGLALISQEKTILAKIGWVEYVTLIASLTAVLNALGRFVYSTLSDELRDRSIIYIIIFISSAVFMVWSFISAELTPLICVLGLLVCNAGYGGGFSTLPSLLSDKFGMKNVSIIHGFTLSAWAFAGLVGNQLGNFIITNYNYQFLFIILTLFYLLAYYVTYKYIRN